MSFTLYDGLLKRYRNGAVIRTVNLSVNFRLLHMLEEFLYDKEIVDTPADITFACVRERIPVAICLGLFRMKITKRVYVPSFRDLIQPLTLDRKEACVILIFLRSR